MMRSTSAHSITKRPLSNSILPTPPPILINIVCSFRIHRMINNIRHVLFSKIHICVSVCGTGTASSTHKHRAFTTKTLLYAHKSCIKFPTIIGYFQLYASFTKRYICTIVLLPPQAITSITHTYPHSTTRQTIPFTLISNIPKNLIK